MVQINLQNYNYAANGIAAIVNGAKEIYEVAHSYTVKKIIPYSVAMYNSAHNYAVKTAIDESKALYNIAHNYTMEEIVPVAKDTLCAMYDFTIIVGVPASKYLLSTSYGFTVDVAIPVSKSILSTAYNAATEVGIPLAEVLFDAGYSYTAANIAPTVKDISSKAIKHAEKALVSYSEEAALYLLGKKDYDATCSYINKSIILPAKVTYGVAYSYGKDVIMPEVKSTYDYAINSLVEYSADAAVNMLGEDLIDAMVADI